MACGLSEVGARRLLAAQRLIAGDVAAGRITPSVGVAAAQHTALTLLRQERAELRRIRVVAALVASGRVSRSAGRAQVRSLAVGASAPSGCLATSAN